MEMDILVAYVGKSFPLFFIYSRERSGVKHGINGLLFGAKRFVLMRLFDC
jgi:hypothetical protein